MRKIISGVAAATAILGSSGTAAAEVRRAPSTPVFAGDVVGDTELSGARAGYAVGPRLTRNTFASMVDTQTRADFRDTASIGRTTMDIWWGSTGIELIANSVRGSTPQ